jgi:hypothetical protein
MHRTNSGNRLSKSRSAVIFVNTLYGKLKSVNITRLIQKGAVCSCDSWMDGLITYPQM